MRKSTERFHLEREREEGIHCKNENQGAKSKNKIICGKPIEPDKSLNSKPVLTAKCVNNLYGPGTIKAPLANSYELETISVPRHGPDSFFEQSISKIKGLYGPCQ